jgi:hypothetical protein
MLSEHASRVIGYVRLVYKKAEDDALAGTKDQPPTSKPINWLEQDLCKQPAAEKLYKARRLKQRDKVRRTRSLSRALRCFLWVTELVAARLDSVPLRLFKSEADINGILPAGGGPLPIISFRS